MWWGSGWGWWSWSVRAGPYQDAGFWLYEFPPLSLLNLMMMAAQGNVVALAVRVMTWSNHSPGAI
jgi:hypothetical protein